MAECATTSRLKQGLSVRMAECATTSRLKQGLSVRMAECESLLSKSECGKNGLMSGLEC